jgi:hypothetical protein
MEYFSWQLLNDLIKRVVAADMVLCQVDPFHDQRAIEGLTVLRVFLKRAYIYSGSVAQDSVRFVRVLKYYGSDLFASAEYRTRPVFGSPIEKFDAITRGIKSKFYQGHAGIGADLFFVG